MWRLLLTLSVCFIWGNLYAQQAYRTEYFSTNDGLSHRWLNCVYQDTRGYIWIGSYDGLNRFDGHEFQFFRPSSNKNLPLSADFIYQIAELPDSTFFLGTGAGLLHYDPKSNRVEMVLSASNPEAALILNPGKGASFLDVNMSDLLKNPRLKIYKVNTSGGLELLAETGLPAQKAIYPMACTEKEAWFWDLMGHYVLFDIKSGSWQTIPVPGAARVPIDAAGQLWLPDDGPQLKSYPVPVHHDTWKTLTLVPGKEVWLYALTDISTNTFNVYHLDLQNNHFFLAIEDFNGEYLGSHFNQLYRPGICTDKEGTIWFGGFQGLCKVRFAKNYFKHYLASIFRPSGAPPYGISTREMVEDRQGNIILKDNSYDLYKINPLTGTTTKIQPPPLKTDHISSQPLAPNQEILTEKKFLPNNPRAIVGDAEGYIWMLTGQGIYRYEPLSGTYVEYPGDPLYLEENLLDDGRGKIWQPAGDRLFWLDKKTGLLQQAPGRSYGTLNNGVITQEDNTLWGFTDTGLVKTPLDNLIPQPIRLYDTPRQQRCLLSHRGWLWIGTSRGLEKVNPKTFAHTNYDRYKGLPANFIYCMVADGDYLWLGTSDGLCRFEIETGNVKNFYIEDGLSHHEFNTRSAFKARDGKIYMGGLNGLNVFSPAELDQKIDRKAQLVLSGFNYYDTQKDSVIQLNPYQISGAIELGPSINSFSFLLSLLSYIDPGKNQYAWQMEGLDNDWYYAGSQHVATYRQIPPGTYTFRAKAADSFGNWSENEITLRIVVLSPWYERWWAWVIYIFLTGILAIRFYRGRIRQKLEQAEKRRLRELDEFKNRFFTNITHEFRTPLTVVLGMTEQLNANPDVPRQPLALIKRNAESLMRLINQILDLSKLESNSLKINYINGDILPYIRYICESLHSLANTQNVMLRVESDQAAIAMDYDPERILQIIYNLVSNALKFTPSGGKVVLRADVATMHNEPHLHIRVKDTGVGIAADELPRVFNRFYQADNLEKAKAGGTGIGLSLTKELVKAMGGDISAESTTGSGSTFMVWLPIKNTAPKQTAPVGQAPENSSGAGALPYALVQKSRTEWTGEQPAILIIEDNPDVVEYIAAFLAPDVDADNNAYRLDFAYNGRAGIEKALETIPDLVISDVMMPEKDGFQVCETLKSDERTSHIPVVLLTAKAGVENRITGLHSGADAYLEKPFHREELLATLGNLLEVRRKLRARYSALSATAPQDASVAQEEGRGPDIEDAFVQKVKNNILERLSDPELTVETLCRSLALSQRQLHRKLTALTGKNAIQFIRAIRLARAKELLADKTMNVSEVAFEVGFDDPKYFSRVFTEEFGVPPSKM